MFLRCLALPKLPERGRSFSRPVSHLSSFHSLSLALFSLSLSLSLEISSRLVFSFFLFLSFPRGFGPSLSASPHLAVLDLCFCRLPAAPYIPYPIQHIQAALGTCPFCRSTIDTISAVQSIYLCSTGANQQ